MPRYDRPQWTMPHWMEPYRDLLPDGRRAEEFMNSKATFNNAPTALLAQNMVASVTMLEKLHRTGLLRPREEQGPTLHRTVVSIRGILLNQNEAEMSLLVSGADCPLVWRPTSILPKPLLDTLEADKVFFAWCNLCATTPDEMIIKDIEPEWGDTGPLHFGEA